MSSSVAASIDLATGARKLEREMRPSDPLLISPTQVIMSRDGRTYVANFDRAQMTLFFVQGLK